MLAALVLHINNIICIYCSLLGCFSFLNYVDIGNFWSGKTQLWVFCIIHKTSENNHNNNNNSLMQNIFF